LPVDGIGPVPNPKAPKPFSPEVLALTFSELALYGNCPHAFRLSTEFDVATPIVRELGFGKSIHHILRRIADEAKATRKIPGSSELDALFASEFHLPYASAAGYQKMQAAARKLVDRYVKDWSDDLQGVWEVERPFELHLEKVIVIGRADVILNRMPGDVPKLTIVDYKSYRLPEHGRATEARQIDQTTRDQLRTYVAAARAEGLLVEDALLHDLQSSTRHKVSVAPEEVRRTTEKALEWAVHIQKGEFPAKPERNKCRACNYKRICQHSGPNAAA
jgi:DNA helicase-2/ATP-dependent DNA helicase PcrA